MHLVTEMSVNAVKREQPVGSHGLAAWLVSTVRRLKEPAGRTARKHMRVVETLPIGVKKQLLLVSCDGERFLVATGADSVGTITRVRPESGVAGVRVEGAVR